MGDTIVFILISKNHEAIALSGYINIKYTSSSYLLNA